MSERATSLQAGFLDGYILADYLPSTPGEGIVGVPMYSWSTNVCQFVTRHLCTGIFCGDGPITRDPIDCPPPPINE